jgi:UDP-N-acetylglucosamine/UDP-N-acetylgalactosamine diphosphorylase
MANQRISKIEKLLDKGVQIPNPESVQIGDDLTPEQISGEGVVIYSGCKIFGSSTHICRGTRLGYEAPVTIENCQIGPQVELKGGFFKDSVFLEKTSSGLGAHIRGGTIMEEESNIAHNVGLKQTILFPFATLGSLINFCDCLMSGGTSRKDHSEVGSSYIHFNYTPNQDKATPSLIGDVPRGVMLNQRPIFLGGQGGLVGPRRLEFGTIIAAGSIHRKDELNQGRLLFSGAGKGGNVLFMPGLYRNVKRIVKNNIIYIANLLALVQWYNHVRAQFVSDDFPRPLLDSLKEKLNMAIAERINRFNAFCLKMPESIKLYQKSAKEHASALLLQQKNELYERWPEIQESFSVERITKGDEGIRDAFLKKLDIGIKKSGKDYISVIQSLSTDDSEVGTRWLQGIVDHVIDEALKTIPSYY